MKVKFTDLLNHHQDDTIKFKEKNVANSKNVMRLTGVTRHNAFTERTKPRKAISWGIGVAVAMMSCVTVYAVESGAIDSLKDYFKQVKVPYSYSGNYNQIDENYIYDHIETNFTTEVISDDNPNSHIEITGYVADDYNMYITGNIVFDDGNYDVIKSAKTINFDYWYDEITADNVLSKDSKFYNQIKKEVDIYAPIEQLNTTNWEEKYPISEIGSFLFVSEVNDIWTDDNYDQVARPYVNGLGHAVATDPTIIDNKLAFVYVVDSTNATMEDFDAIDVKIAGITKSNYWSENVPTYNVDEIVRVTFDKESLKQNVSTMTNTISNLNINCEGYDGNSYDISSITYSPLGFSIDFTESIISCDSDWWQRPYFTSGLYKYPTVYLIYNDGSKVFQGSDEDPYETIWGGYADKYVDKRNHTRNDDYTIIGTSLTLGEYATGVKYTYTQPVDYTNVVSIEINGTVIPLK
jgi:hypothetical protein